MISKRKSEIETLFSVADSTSAGRRNLKVTPSLGQALGACHGVLFKLWSSFNLKLTAILLSIPESLSAGIFVSGPGKSRVHPAVAAHALARPGAAGRAGRFWKEPLVISKLGGAYFA